MLVFSRACLGNCAQGVWNHKLGNGKWSRLQHHGKMARATRTTRMENASQVGGMEFSVAAAFRTESGSKRASHAISLAYMKHGGIELLSVTLVEAAPEHRGVFGASHRISDAASSGTHMSFSDVHASSLIFL
ncbi:hypothetical protein TRVL_03357 [Trypanosoma vivax]|nr:hypothetical protein TRVL_03357 [Trypanosoma vivax]